MAQDLTVNIKTTSDVPQAMDKAKSATVSFGKQVEDIQKKFSTAFKDIAFAFVELSHKSQHYYMNATVEDGQTHQLIRVGLGNQKKLVPPGTLFYFILLALTHGRVTCC